MEDKYRNIFFYTTREGLIQQFPNCNLLRLRDPQRVIYKGDQ